MEGHGDGVPVGSPRHAAEGRPIEHEVHVAILPSEELAVGAVTGAEHPVHVPRKDVPAATGLVVDVLVLAVADAPRVPDPKAGIEDEHPHPLIEVGEVEEVGLEGGCCAG